GSSGSYREILITAQGRELPLPGAQPPMAEVLVKALAVLPENTLTSTAGLPGGNSVVAGGLALRSAIPGADLSMVMLVDEKTVYGQITSRFFLYSASVVPLIVLIVAFMFERGRRVEVALARSEQRFRTIFDNIRDAILIVDIDDGSILDANPSVLELYGIKRDELPGLSLADISEPRSGGDSQDWPARMARAAGGAPQFFELRARHRSGERFWSEISMLRASIDGRDRLVLVARDISQRKEQEQELVAALEYQRQLNKRLEEAQNQLLQSEKMASLGQLAAGVAHEINNPVGFVNSNLSTLKRYFADLLQLLSLYEQDEGELSPTTHAEVAALKDKIDVAYVREDVANLMTESIDGLQRVKRIVQDLKDFSHVGESEKQLANLERGLDATLNMVWNELKYKAEIVKEYAGLPDIECISMQINQVFMNLLVNAAQAIEVRGRITVRTGQLGEEVWIEVEDSGCGIPAENLKRIFDPFFTTKPVGKGTGLGLSLSYGIVQRHHGRLVVSSEPGKGTVFRVWLPLRQPKLDVV
ncbi:MAG: ATP-binding protein, partial [Spirochaetota bacterium]